MVPFRVSFFRSLIAGLSVLRHVPALAVSVLLAFTVASGQEAAPAEAGPGEVPVWRAADLGRHVAETMAAPIWSGDQEKSSAVDSRDLRLQLQVIEAHAVGQALGPPYLTPVTARQAFAGYFGTRFLEEGERKLIRAGLKKWGVAYSSAIELGQGDESRTLELIGQVFSTSLEVDKSSELGVWASEVWRATVEGVDGICREALRHSMVVPDDD